MFSKILSKISLMTVFGLGGIAAALAPAAAQQPQQGLLEVGVLECNISPGVGFVITANRALSCSFRPHRHRLPVENYTGTIRNFGLDIGATGPGRLIWTVISTTGPIKQRYPLAGTFTGAVGSFAIGGGIGANALVGGNANSFTLQPVSLTAQSGLSLAAGIGTLTLEPVPTSAK
ncbi:DUF992 domain-containing protein [Beijerinckia mobilis]|uniref:DUF992 domain-containing protein n=1 Tax=Beijerinckia mobilis TaxID=231434 RepID=UPI0005501CAA|nr:DUF992 domain-containing protein [Beijerinckia mobilis]